MPYVVKLIKAGKVHGMMGPYTTLKTAKRDAQMLADGAEKGVKVYVEQDVPSYLGGTGEGPHYKAKRSTSTKRNPKFKKGEIVKYIAGGSLKRAPYVSTRSDGWIVVQERGGRTAHDPRLVHADKKAAKAKRNPKGVWVKAGGYHHYRDPDTGETLADVEDTFRTQDRNHKATRYEVKGELFGGLREAKAAAIATARKRNPHLKPGDRVKVDGYTGTVVRDLGGDQYEVRMPGGLAVKSLAGVPPIRGGRAKGGAKRNPSAAKRAERTVLAVMAEAARDDRAGSFTLLEERKAIKRLASEGVVEIVSEGPSGYKVSGHRTEIMARMLKKNPRGKARSNPKRKNPDTDVVSDMGDVYVERDRIDGTYSVVVYDGSRYLVASEWTREAPAIKDAKAWRSMPIRGRRAAIAASYKRNPSRKQMENAIAGKMPPGSKKGRGASRVIMLTGDSAKVLGVKNYTKLLMASLTNDQVDTLHKFLVLRIR